MWCCSRTSNRAPVPTYEPTLDPTVPTPSPSHAPTIPSLDPTISPSSQPTPDTVAPTNNPSQIPSIDPSTEPTTPSAIMTPTREPSISLSFGRLDEIAKEDEFQIICFFALAIMGIILLITILWYILKTRIFIDDHRALSACSALRDRQAMSYTDIVTAVFELVDVITDLSFACDLLINYQNAQILFALGWLALLFTCVGVVTLLIKSQIMLYVVSVFNLIFFVCFCLLCFFFVFLRNFIALFLKTTYCNQKTLVFCNFTLRLGVELCGLKKDHRKYIPNTTALI